LTAEI